MELLQIAYDAQLIHIPFGSLVRFAIERGEAALFPADHSRRSAGLWEELPEGTDSGSQSGASHSDQS